MSGTLRFVLAVLVVISHLIATPFVHHFGFYAVRGFFVLSGLSMTAALNEVYRFELARFFANRMLRLLPGYLVACLATGAAIWCWPADAAAFMPRWAFSPTLTNIVQNLLIVPLAFHDPDFRFMEPAWSIAVELAMYFFLFIGIARSERGASLGLIAGAAYHVAVIVIGAPFSFRYFSIPPAVLSFSIGALLYFWCKRQAFVPRPSLAIVGGIAWLINLAVAGGVPNDFAELGGYYVGIVLSAVALGSLHTLKPRPALGRVDAILGHLSYPIFLFQWLGGFLAHEMFLPSEWRGWDLLLVAVPIILLLSAFTATLQVLIVEPIRRLIRELPAMSAGTTRWVGPKENPAFQSP